MKGTYVPRELSADDIISKYQGGQSMQAIAQFGRIPVRHVRKVLADAGVSIRNTPREMQARVAKILAEHGAEIIRRYQAGESGKSLGHRYGVAPSTISGFIDVRGVRRRTRREALKLTHQQQRAAKPI
jgi:hypothetical protein